MSSFLFTGYAPVHFACFKPLYERLVDVADVEVVLSGGIRTMTPYGVSYDPAMLYGAFGLEPCAYVGAEEIKRRDFDVLFSAHTGRIAPRSYGRAVQIFHGISLRNMAIREENGDFDHYFLAGQYMRRGFESRDLLRPGDPRGASIGFMKTDRLLDGSLDRGSVLASLGLRGDRPIVLYAPTGAKGNSLETFGADLVKMLAAEDAYDVVVKLHDHPRGWVDWFEQLEVMEGQHVRIARTPDIVPILYAADLLVTDASSVSNEYALLDRPIVFLDVPLLFDEVRARGAMLDLDLRKGGRIAVDANDAMLAVKEELARPARLSVERQAIAADLFYNPGRATDEALAWVGSELT